MSDPVLQRAALAEGTDPRIAEFIAQASNEQKYDPVREAVVDLLTNGRGRPLVDLAKYSAIARARADLFAALAEEVIGRLGSAPPGP